VEFVNFLINIYNNNINNIGINDSMQNNDENEISELHNSMIGDENASEHELNENNYFSIHSNVQSVTSDYLSNDDDISLTEYFNKSFN
jgi:hypothetical protein